MPDLVKLVANQRLVRALHCTAVCLVSFWCLSGAFLVYSKFTSGVLLVYFWCTCGIILVYYLYMSGVLLVVASLAAPLDTMIGQSLHCTNLQTLKM